MDPLDKILSVIVMNAILVVSEDTEAEDLKRFEYCYHFIIIVIFHFRKKVSNIVSKSDSFGKRH